MKLLIDISLSNIDINYMFNLIILFDIFTFLKILIYYVISQLLISLEIIKLT